MKALNQQFNKDLGKRIRARRKALHMNYPEIARRLYESDNIEFGEAAWFMYENGNRTIPLAYINPLCKILECEPNELLGWKGNANV